MIVNAPWTDIAKLIWFGLVVQVCIGLLWITLVYFGLLCFGLESVWNPAYHGPWTDIKEKKNINGVGYRVAAQLKT